MRKSFVVTAVMTIALLGSAGLLLSDPMGPDGQPDISGAWVGKAKVKGYDMTGMGYGEKEKVGIQVKIGQRGSSIFATISPEDGDSIEMDGYIGDGHLWMYGEDNGPMVLVGHVKSKGKKIKAKLLAGEEFGCIEVSLQLKRLPVLD